MSIQPAFLVVLTMLGICGSPAPLPAGDLPWQPADLRQVELGGECGRRIAVTIQNNLLQIDLDKHFLPAFASRSARGQDAYIGLGKTLDGMVRLAAHTRHPGLVARKKQTVERLLALQGEDGYLGIMRPEARTWQLWDLHEQAYLIRGLLADYQWFGETASRDAGVRLGRYIAGRLPGRPADWLSTIPTTEDLGTIGLKHAFLALHQATGDQTWKDILLGTFKADTWQQPIVLGRHGKIAGHMYAYFSHCLVQLELHRQTSQDHLLAPTRQAMDFLLAQDGLFVSGGAGHAECWSKDQNCTGHLGETCSTYYQMQVYDALLRREHAGRWGDLIERTIFNAAFAAQSPDGRRLRYYAPLEGKREYFGRDTYCCPGNYRRLAAELPSLMGYQAPGEVVVSQYSPSTLRLTGVADKPVVITQKTGYPSTDQVVISVDPAVPSAFALFLRIPAWCRSPVVAINGQAITEPVQPGAFLRLHRTWKPGDSVRLDLPMSWRFIAGRKAQAGKAAVMRGPMLYTLARANVSQPAPAPAAVPPPAPGLDILANHRWLPSVEQNGRQGKPMRLGTTDYPRGLFCHAPSTVVVRLPGPGRRFTAMIGVDANNDAGVKGSVVFSVQAKGKALFISAVLKGKDAGVPVTVDLGGATEFTLTAGDGGDNIFHDQACWADARVELANGSALDLGQVPMRDLRSDAGNTLDLRRLVLLPKTAELVADTSVRPDGTACRIKADLDTPGQGAITLLLTEFADPQGECAYFRLADPAVAVGDEICQPAKP